VGVELFKLVTIVRSADHLPCCDLRPRIRDNWWFGEANLPPLLEYLNNDTNEFAKFLIEIAYCMDSFFIDEFDYDELELNISSQIIRNQVKNQTMRKWFEEQTATWNRKFAPEFIETFTKRGMGFTFNLQNVSDILNSDEY
jgi:hypothetical protein